MIHKYAKKIFPAVLCLIAVFFISCSGGVHYYLPSEPERVYTGLEIFIKNYADKYKDKKAILVTNHSGVDFSLTMNLKLLRKSGISVFAVIAPEHGLYGYMNDYDKKTFYPEDRLNAVIYNMHKLPKRDLTFLIKTADLVFFDIQDMGMRCYTYISNLKKIMDSMNGLKTELIVLDRPDPIGFLGVDGPALDRKFSSKFISSFPAPFIYNMTLGEAAMFYKGEYRKKINLRVIKMKNYNRDMFFHETTLPWIPPSPNLPTYKSSIVYTAVVLLEGTNISLGRGTTKPFEYIGAPWIEPESFCRGLDSLKLKNFRFKPVYFKPTFNKFEGEVCGGAQIFYTGGVFSPTETSFKLIKFIKDHYKEIKWTKYKSWYDIDALAATDRFRKAIDADKPYPVFRKKIQKGINLFNDKRDKYLLY